MYLLVGGRSRIMRLSMCKKFCASNRRTRKRAKIRRVSVADPAAAVAMCRKDGTTWKTLLVVAKKIITVRVCCAIERKAKKNNTSWLIQTRKRIEIQSSAAGITYKKFPFNSPTGNSNLGVTDYTTDFLWRYACRKKLLTRTSALFAVTVVVDPIRVAK